MDNSENGLHREIEKYFEELDSGTGLTVEAKSQLMGKIQVRLLRIQAIQSSRSAKIARGMTIGIILLAVANLALTLLWHYQLIT